MKMICIGELVQILLPVIILITGIMGLFTDKLSREDSHALITAGCLASGLHNPKKDKEM